MFGESYLGHIVEERDVVSAHTQNLYVTQRRVCSRAWCHVTSRDAADKIFFYTIIKRLFCTGIFTETCKACSKTLKNVNINLPDRNSKHSPEETILGFIPCLPESAASRHQHPPTQRIRFPSLKVIFRSNSLYFSVDPLPFVSAKGGNIIEFEVKISAGDRVEVSGASRGG